MSPSWMKREHGMVSLVQTTINGGYSYLTDVTIGSYEEIIVTGFFGGEITFGPQGSNIVISNFCSTS